MAIKIETSTPIKPIIKSECICPICRHIFAFGFNNNDFKKLELNKMFSSCPNCKQKIDWSDII